MLLISQQHASSVLLCVLAILLVVLIPKCDVSTQASRDGPPSGRRRLIIFVTRSSINTRNLTRDNHHDNIEPRVAIRRGTTQPDTKRQQPSSTIVVRRARRFGQDRVHSNIPRLAWRMGDHLFRIRTTRSGTCPFAPEHWKPQYDGTRSWAPGASPGSALILQLCWQLARWLHNNHPIESDPYRGAASASAGRRACMQPSQSTGSTTSGSLGAPKTTLSPPPQSNAPPTLAPKRRSSSQS